MTQVLVLYYSGYGHVETLAEAVAEGAGEVDGTEVTVKRVPELVPEEVARTILWLASDEASYITATLVNCSGGR